MEEARKDNLKLYVHLICCGVIYPVCYREEMVLELRNETAALKAQLELQAQEVSVLLGCFNELLAFVLFHSFNKKNYFMNRRK